MARPTPVLPLVGSTIVPPGCSSPLCLGRLDHAQGDAVLHRPAGVEVLDLRQDGGLDALGDAVELHQRGVADEADHRVVELHRGLRCCKAVVSEWCGQRMPAVSRCVHWADGHTPSQIGRSVAYGARGSGVYGYEEVAARMTMHVEGESGTADRDRGRVRRRRDRPARRRRRWGWCSPRCSWPSARSVATADDTTAAPTACTAPPSPDSITSRPAAARLARRLHGRGPGRAPGRGRPRAHCSPRRSRRWPNARWSCATWRCPGAQSDDLERQVTLLLGEHDLELARTSASIMIGANDVTHRMPPTQSVR